MSVMNSYLECDRNMALINCKFPAEVPDDWVSEIQNSRSKPSPFKVIEADLTLFRSWTVFFQNFTHGNVLLEPGLFGKFDS